MSYARGAYAGEYFVEEVIISGLCDSRSGNNMSSSKDRHHCQRRTMGIEWASIHLFRHPIHWQASGQTKPRRITLGARKICRRCRALRFARPRLGSCIFKGPGNSVALMILDDIIISILLRAWVTRFATPLRISQYIRSSTPYIVGESIY